MAKIAMVTGAGGGIGREVALALARRGYHLLLVGRDELRLQATAGDAQAGAIAGIFPVDLSATSACERLSSTILNDFAVPDLVVHNAAVMSAGSFLDRSMDEIASSMFVNLFAPAILTRGLCSGPRLPGGMIFMLSTAARFPQPFNSLYTGSKSGLRAFAEALQVEVSGKMRVCLVYPPLTATRMTAGFSAVRWPLSKVNPVVVAEKIVAGYEAGRNEITWLDWEILPSLFYRLAPRLFRRLMEKNRGAIGQMLSPRQ